MVLDSREAMQKLDTNYAIAKKLYTFLAECKEEPVEEQLEIIETIAYFLSERVTGVYSSHELESKLKEISQEILFESDDKPIEGKYLFVMTSASKGGGSTVLVNNWIRWDNSKKYSIVFTDYDYINKEVPDFLEKTVVDSGGEIFFLSGSFMEKATVLLDISKKYEKIICMQHQADIVPNLAYCNQGWNKPVIMYNHANFRFSLGYEFADVVLNLNEYDKEKTSIYRGISGDNNLYLQIPNAGRLLNDSAEFIPSVNDKLYVIEKYKINTSKKIIVTMGEQFKLTDIVGCSFVEFVKRLVNELEDKIQYLVIGPNPNDVVWKSLRDSTKGLARAVGYIDRKEATTIISMADFYVPGFPMLTSGTYIAEKFNIPYMAMALIERVEELLSGKTVDSIDKLIACIKDSLSGNADRYRQHCDFHLLDREEWLEEWHNIDRKVTRHKLQTIHPKRLIKEEEIINVQLMDANKHFINSRNNRNMSGNLYEKLRELEKEYQISLVPKRVSSVDADVFKAYLPLESLCTKNIKLFEFTSRWFRLEMEGHHISEYLRRQGYDVVSIYGMGEMGINLYHALKNQKFEVECFIDKKSKQMETYHKIENEIKCISLEECPLNSKIVINTAVVDIGVIKEEYKGLMPDIMLVSIFDIIERMESEERN